MTERRRLLVVASTFPGRPDDGTPAFVRDVALEEAKEFETLVLVPSVPGAPAVHEGEGLRVERFRWFPRRWEDLADGAILENLRARPSRWLQVVPFLVAEALAMRRAIRRFRPDVVHVHWIVPQGLVGLVGAPAGVPWLTTVHGGDLYALQNRVLDRLRARVVRRSKVLTVPNEQCRTRLIELGAAAGSTHWLPMPADVASFRTPPGHPRVAGRMLFVGRLVEKKGVAVLLEALGQVDAGWQLDIVGDGPLRGALESTAARFGDRVRFLGQRGRAAVADLMRDAEMLVVPSVAAASGDQDGLPVVVLEAMGAGCAIVASSLPGIDQAIESERNGLLVEPGDAVALGEALQRLLGDAALRRRLGDTAAVDAERFSRPVVGEKFRGLLRVLASGQPAG